MARPGRGEGCPRPALLTHSPSPKALDGRPEVSSVETTFYQVVLGLRTLPGSSWACRDRLLWRGSGRAVTSENARHDPQRSQPPTAATKSMVESVSSTDSEVVDFVEVGDRVVGEGRTRGCSRPASVVTY